jgi:16S rRNA (cytosine1402-N4)-methyltransferase
MSMYHKPVLLTESIDGLAIKKDGTYVDVTYGGGGHSAEILKSLGKKGRLLAFDRDTDSLKNEVEDERLILINHNFRFLKNYLRYYDAVPVDGIIADLGISSHQIDEADRGFSTRFDSDLDMRMDRRMRKTGADIVNTYDQIKLQKIFNDYGEVENPHKVAGLIVKCREEKKIITTTDLKMALVQILPRNQEQKFLAKIFQAIRIELNQELEALQQMLLQSLDVLASGGRLVVISYHSLEDRLVKNFMKSGNFSGVEDKDPIYGKVSAPFRVLTRKPIAADGAEVLENKRSRSAHLRIAEKI